MGVSVEPSERWDVLVLNATRKMPMTLWLPKGWRCPRPSILFPTFVRAIVRSKPPFKPAGIHTCDAAALERYKAARYIYSPYQFKEENLLLSPQKLRWFQGVPLPG